MNKKFVKHKHNKKSTHIVEYVHDIIKLCKDKSTLDLLILDDMKNLTITSIESGFYYACVTNNTKIMKYVMDQKQDISNIEDGLQYICESDNINLFCLLDDKKYNYDCLYLASKYESMNILKYLLLSVNPLNYHFKVAYKYKCNKVINLLLQNNKLNSIMDSGVFLLMAAQSYESLITCVPKEIIVYIISLMEGVLIREILDSKEY
jgi:hypothetical protein